jgi:hypothetical protein
MTRRKEKPVQIPSLANPVNPPLKTQKIATEKYRAVSNGKIQNPPINKVRLEDYINYCPNIGALAKAVAYGICYKPEKRNTEDYCLVYNSFNKKMDYWNNWIVYRIKEGEDLNNLLLVNISIYYRIKGLPITFLTRLLEELKILMKTA